MSDAQLLMVAVGFVINLVVMISGIVGLAFAQWRWISAMRTELGERLAAVETDIKNLQADRRARDGKLHSTGR